MKKYRCTGCRFESDMGKMSDNLCPYCGEIMEEVAETSKKLFNEEDIDE